MTHSLHGEECGRERRKGGGEMGKGRGRRRGESKKEMGMSGRWEGRKSN